MAKGYVCGECDAAADWYAITLRDGHRLVLLYCNEHKIVGRFEKDELKPIENDVIQILCVANQEYVVLKGKQGDWATLEVLPSSEITLMMKGDTFSYTGKDIYPLKGQKVS